MILSSNIKGCMNYVGFSSTINSPRNSHTTPYITFSLPPWRSEQQLLLLCYGLDCFLYSHILLPAISAYCVLSWLDSSIFLSCASSWHCVWALPSSCSIIWLMIHPIRTQPCFPFWVTDWSWLANIPTRGEKSILTFFILSYALCDDIVSYQVGATMQPAVEIREIIQTLELEFFFGGGGGGV